MSISCCYGLYNYGRGDCTTVIDEIVGLIQVPLRKTDGTPNQIALGSPFTATQVNALLVNADRKARWYPFPRLYGVSLPIADTVFDEATDGSKSFVREGIWSFAGELRDKDAVPPMLGKLKKARCAEWGMFAITKTNQLVGEVNIDGTALLPLRVNNGSFDPKMMFRDAQATNKISVAFDFDSLVRQEKLYVLTGEEVGVDFNRLQKLQDVTLVADNQTTTSVEIAVKTAFSQGLLPNNDVVGLNDLTDFDLTNETTGLPITVIAIDEIADGVYELTFVAQTLADKIKVEMNIADTFYEGKTTYIV